ncbi:MAG: hypothetical protein OEU51_00625 [Gammaproteobacteria bacterium]|nr:hypothetical protein [Gammaproteobacteria bacterium]
MTAPEDLVLDEDGVPILTDVVSSGQEFGTAPIADNQLAHMSVEDITQTILGSESIRYRLDDIATELTRSVRNQLEQLLRPAIEQAVTEVIDDSGSAAFDAIRQQLDNALPEILADLLQEDTPGNS